MMTTAPNQAANPSRLSMSSYSFKDQLYNQQIAQLYTLAPVGIIASLLTGLILVVVLWKEIHHQVLINWFVIVVVINVIWCILVYQYQRMSPSVVETSSWGTRFIVGNTLSGLIWGAAGFLLYPVDTMPHEIFLTLVLGGMITGSTTIHSALPKAFFAFSLPTFLPLTFQFFQQGDELHYSMGMLSLLFVTLMGVTVQRNHHMVLACMTLRYENAQLLDQASLARDRLESIVEKRTAELKTAETRYRLVADNITDVIWVMALDGSHFTYISPSIISFRGYTPEEAMVLSLEESLIFTSAQKARAVLEEELAIEQSGLADPFRSRVMVLEHRRKDGSTVWAEVRASILRTESGSIIGVVGVTRDITERQQLEEERQGLMAQLQHTQKIETIGILAGGIAHDFNNYLTSILGNILLARNLNTSTKLRAKFLGIAEQAILRAKDLTHHLLTFAKGGEPIKQLVSLDTVIKQSSNFSLSGSTVACEHVFQPDLWPTNVDAGQMSQVFHNLLRNAVQVMPNGGVLTIRAENLSLDTNNTNVFERKIPLAPGPYVRVSLRDEGCGIPDHHLAKIFDPYFTTKSDGHGLGLASVYSIMKKHGGLVLVDSELGIGTEFTLLVPASPYALIPGDVPILQLKQGGGRILVMDDDESIRVLAAEILTRNGYGCEMAKD